ncbi:MAG TPA: LysM peptidoglycan-binding domain-containing protein [Solidesulfovibrio magneticus]|nr:LysM peptidoglycan-binding domain-containing protein [Solidesulfovibrio magneticus]
MQITLMRLLPAAICLLPNLLFAAAQSASPPVATSSQSQDTYIVQAGDTLVGIARRHGLTPDALAKANALDRPDKIIVGNVLRLPVTPPERGSTPMAPAPAKASAAQPAPAATPPETAQPAAPEQAKPPTQVQPMPQSQSPTPAQAPAKGDAMTAAKATTPGIVPTPPAKDDDATGDAARLAVGSYANPTLGVLRVTQTPAGIAVSRDNRTIAMRHLLYGVFDGTDATGDIQGLRLQFDDDGQVRALLYSSSSGKDIPFTRMKK